MKLVSYSLVTLRSSGTDILYGWHLLRRLYNILYFLWLYNEFFIILYNILKIAELDCCQIIILSISRLVIGTSRTVGSAKKFVRITSGFGGGEFTKTLRNTDTWSPVPPFSSLGPSRDYGMDLCLEVYLWTIYPYVTTFHVTTLSF
jgi:hypothetical protein